MAGRSHLCHGGPGGLCRRITYSRSTDADTTAPFARRRRTTRANHHRRHPGSPCDGGGERAADRYAARDRRRSGTTRA